MRRIDAYAHDNPSDALSIEAIAILSSSLKKAVLIHSSYSNIDVIFTNHLPCNDTMPTNGRRVFLTTSFAVAGLSMAEESPRAFLMVRTSKAVKVFLNGTQVADSPVDTFTKYTVVPGDNLILLISEDGSLRWEGIVHVPPSEQRIIQPLLINTDHTIGVPSKFTDPFDRQIYNTVRIGRKEWFAQNYNAPRQGSIQSNSGKLYAPTSAVAPNGWRIPAKADFEELINTYTDPFTELTIGKSGMNIEFSGGTDDNTVRGVGEYANYWTATAGVPKKNLGDHEVATLWQV